VSALPQEVRNLVARFDRNREAYKDSSYNEAQVRSEFIDPLFEALGWDVYNKHAYAEAYKDIKTSIQRQIDATDRQIDQLVYELYGLTNEEIRIVEEATR
jgi:hypothetical protein